MAIGDGISLFPWRGPQWAGAQTGTPSDHGEHQFVRIVGGYVAGQEIRTFPGWKCILNPVENGPGVDGYKTLVVDSERPCAGPTFPSDVLRERVPFTTIAPAVIETISVRDTQKVWAEPRHLHAFMRVREKMVLIGESGLRVEPILDTATGTVISKMTAWEMSAGFAVIVLGPIPGAVTPGFCNQVSVGHPVWIDTVTDAGNAADAARLSRRVHYVTAYDAVLGKITLNTTVAAGGTLTNLSVNIGRCRGNQSGSFGPDGRREFGESATNSILDDESLTAYWVEDRFDMNGVPIEKVYPSYIANRQRDYGDDSAVRAGVGSQMEGHRSTAMVAAGVQYGVPRRRTMRLPLRVVPHLAGDRILIAAPGYGCMLQIPAVVPTTSSSLSRPTVGGAQNYNAPWARPRSLGIPKGQLAVPNSPQGIPLSRGRADAGGFTLGKYSFAIAYRDDATGEIGQLSEVMTVDNTDGRYTEGTVGPGSTTTVFPIATSFPTILVGELVGFTIRFVTGAQTGQTSVIIANTATDITVGVAIAGAPADHDGFYIVGLSLTLRLAIMHPGYALCETMALSVMIYMSRIGESTLLHVATIQPNDDRLVWTVNNYDDGASTSSVYGLPGTSSPSAHEMFWYYSIPVALQSKPTLYNANVEIPEFRSMPRGASWVRVVRGVRVSGGSIGNTGLKKELLAGEAYDLYSGPTGDGIVPDQLTIGRTNGDGVWLLEWPFVGSRLIPDSYASAKIWSTTLWPHPMETATLDRLMNCQAETFSITTSGGGSQARHYSRWHLLENPHRWDGTRYKVAPAYLVMPRGEIQIGEPGLPSVQFQQGVQLVDSNKDEDTVAGGEFRGVVLMMTQFQTYALSWQQGPAGALPSLLAPEIGCIAPNAVVEHADACLWLSNQGVVECNGQIGWTGKSIEQWFRGSSLRFLRDGDGMMRHSWATNDHGRGIVMIGVIENRNNLSISYSETNVTWPNASTEAQSRFPCDTVLTYNPTSGSFSEWQPPSGLEVLWMGPVSCTDGNQRTAFLASDKRLYALDDSFGEDNKEALMCTSFADSASATLLRAGPCLASGVVPSTANANRGGLGSFIRVGMDVCIYNPTTFELKHRSTIASINLYSMEETRITLTDAGTWSTGDIALIGGRTMTVETTYASPKGVSSTQLEAIAVKVALAARSNEPIQNPGYMQQPVWVKVTVTHAEHQSGRHGGGSGLTRSQAMHRSALGDFVAKSDIGKKVDRVVRCASGRINAVSFKVSVELFGGAQVCLQDLLMEVG